MKLLLLCKLTFMWFFSSSVLPLNYKTLEDKIDQVKSHVNFPFESSDMYDISPHQIVKKTYVLRFWLLMIRLSDLHQSRLGIVLCAYFFTLMKDKQSREKHRTNECLFRFFSANTWAPTLQSLEIESKPHGLFFLENSFSLGVKKKHTKETVKSTIK